MSNSDYGELYHPWNKKEQWVPFTDTGNQMYYPERQYEEVGGKWTTHSPVWRLNEVFQDILIYKEYGRGRSAAYFEFERQSTRTLVYMFMTDMDANIPYMTKGVVGGKFTFCKRGQNYGCMRVGD